MRAPAGLLGCPLLGCPLLRCPLLRCPILRCLLLRCLIVALEVVQDTNDQNHLIPMMSATTQIADHLYAATGDDRHRVGTLLADAGYASDDNLAAPGPQRLIALGKGRDQARRAQDDPLTGPPPPGCTRARRWPTRCEPSRG